MQNLSAKESDTKAIHHSVKSMSFLETMRFNLKQRGNIREALKEQYKEHGGVVQIRLMGITLIQLLGPEWNQIVYLNRDAAFSSKNGWDFVLKRIFPGSVMAMDGSEHLYQRRIMSQAFKKPKLVSYLGFMNGFITQGINQWQEKPFD